MFTGSTHPTAPGEDSHPSVAIPLAVVVMAKAAVPGRVKTRLSRSQPQGSSRPALSPEQAAGVHQAMLDCVHDRVTSYLPAAARFLAVDDLAAFAATHAAGAWDDWRVVLQPAGTLGDRLADVWRGVIEAIPGAAVAFLGVDCPDVPAEALRSIARLAGRADALIGPVSDGGYWTLTARAFHPRLLQGIDWGTAAVYDQTRAAAASAGLSLIDLPAWHDVDGSDDLAALLGRLDEHASQHPPGAPGHDAALAALRARMGEILPTDWQHPAPSR